MRYNILKCYAIQFLGEEDEYYLISNDKGFLEECILDIAEELAYSDWAWAYDRFTHHEFSHEDCQRYWNYACADLKDGVRIIELPFCFVPEVTNVETSIFDKSTKYTNCTVEVWENSVTGESSVGWYRTEETEEICGF